MNLTARNDVTRRGDCVSSTLLLVLLVDVMLGPN